MAEDTKTPMLDELEKGPWPSFVKELKRAAEKTGLPLRAVLATVQNEMENRGLALAERPRPDPFAK